MTNIDCLRFLRRCQALVLGQRMVCHRSAWCSRAAVRLPEGQGCKTSLRRSVIARYQRKSMDCGGGGVALYDVSHGRMLYSVLGNLPLVVSDKPGRTGDGPMASRMGNCGSQDFIAASDTCDCDEQRQRAVENFRRKCRASYQSVRSVPSCQRAIPEQSFDGASLPNISPPSLPPSIVLGVAFGMPNRMTFACCGGHGTASIEEFTISRKRNGSILISGPVALMRSR